LIIRYFASRQKRQEYNWQQIDIWAFWSSVFCPNKHKENKATGVIADIHILFLKDPKMPIAFIYRLLKPKTPVCQ